MFVVPEQVRPSVKTALGSHSNLERNVREHEYGVGGGMMKAPIPGMQSAWLAYVSVDDINAATEKAKSLGQPSSRT